MIEEAFELQEKFNSKLDKNYSKISRNLELKKECLLKNTLAIQQELAEMIDSIPWKWWKKMEWDHNNIKIEIIDIFHFVINLAQAAGMDAEEFCDLFYKKNMLNTIRQNKGYRKGLYNKLDKDGIEDNTKLFSEEIND